MAFIHPAGANVAYADRSIRFLQNHVTLRTVAQLATRSGGEVNAQ